MGMYVHSSIQQQRNIRRKLHFSSQIHVKGCRKFSSFYSHFQAPTISDTWFTLYFASHFFHFVPISFVETLLEKPFNNELTKMYILSMLIISFKKIKKYK